MPRSARSSLLSTTTSASPHALRIGEGLVIRHAKVRECLHHVGTLVGRLCTPVALWIA